MSKESQMKKVFAPNEWYRRNFSVSEAAMSTPGLMRLQINSYEEFLQKDIA